MIATLLAGAALVLLVAGAYVGLVLGLLAAVRQLGPGRSARVGLAALVLAPVAGVLAGAVLVRLVVELAR
jgi:hypothetical protein